MLVSLQTQLLKGLISMKDSVKKHRKYLPCAKLGNSLISFNLHKWYNYPPFKEKETEAQRLQKAMELVANWNRIKIQE